VETILDWGLSAILWLQRLSPTLDGLFKTVSLTGSARFYLLFMPALYWCVDTGLGLRIALILMCSAGLNNALQLAFHAPRPFWLSQEVRALDPYPTFGFPSGHAQNAVSFWGRLARAQDRRWLRILAVAWMFLIGLSRVYLAAHFPTDVLAGWLVGAAVLWAFLRWEGPAIRWLKKRGAAEQVLVGFLTSLGLLLPNVLAQYLLKGWQMPAAWATNILAHTGQLPNPLASSDALEGAGAVFGLTVGIVCTARVGRWSVAGPAGQRLARYLLGLAGLVLLWFGLGALLPEPDSLLHYGLLYLRSTLIGLWVVAGAPALFLRLRMAGRP